MYVAVDKPEDSFLAQLIASGLKSDLGKAREFYQRAAKQGNVDAIDALARLRYLAAPLSPRPLFSSTAAKEAEKTTRQVSFTATTSPP